MTDLKTQMQSDLNKMYDHLIKQGRKSTGAKWDACAYRGEGDTMCAVGCLISDEAYNPEMECKSAFKVVGKFPHAFPFLEAYKGSDKASYREFLNSYREFLNYAQLAMHDRVCEDADFAAQVLDGYKDVAREFGLNVGRR